MNYRELSLTPQSPSETGDFKVIRRQSMNKTLYERLGGYDGISAVTADLMQRIKADSELGRFYRYRGEDGIEREEQLLVDFLCYCAGGPMYYTGRDMKTLHKGMKLSESDWTVLLRHLNDTLEVFEVPRAERDDVVAFIQSTKSEIVEIQTPTEATP